MKTVPLALLAHARSGDKGNHANLAVVAWTPAGYEHLRRHLTAQRVAEFFAALGPREVVRYEVPKLLALNFLLRDVLGGGASRSLRVDSQGKLLGTAVLELELPAPSDPSAMVQR